MSTAWATPSRWTFQIEPIREFVRRWTADRTCIVDPFAGTSQIGHHRNDLSQGGQDAAEWVQGLLDKGIRADCVIFDPPYSPRQVAECYAEVGRKVEQADTQSGFYSRVRSPLSALLADDGVALSFGWQSSGFGKDWPTEEILLVQHGGAHNDTICVAQRKPHGHPELFPASTAKVDWVGSRRIAELVVCSAL